MDAIFSMIFGIVVLGLNMMIFMFTNIVIPIISFLAQVIFGLIGAYPKPALIVFLVVAGTVLLATMLG